MKEVFADIVTIGDEILYGQILDTNSQWISQQLDDLGIKVRRKYSISDKGKLIQEAVKESLDQVQIVLITGGLGPTKDDLTKHSLAEFFGMPLELNPSALDDVEGYFKRLGRELTEINRQQAFLPKGSVKITNECGTAPGMWFEIDKKVVVSMPGVPFEMQAMMTKTVLPKIKQSFKLPVILHQVVRTMGIGESWLSEMIAKWEDALPEHLALAYLPGKGQVRLRLTGVGTDRQPLKEEMDQQIAALLPMIQKYIYGFGEIEIEGALGELLKSKELTVATAESCTGGFLSHKLTSCPGSSEYYMGSVIAYHNQVKENELGVSAKSLEKFGAVSEEVAKEMAEGVRKKLKTDIGISTTGIAGPDGGSEEKPVGTVWLGISFGGKQFSRKIQAPGSRLINIEYSAVKAMDFLWQTLNQE